MNDVVGIEADGALGEEAIRAAYDNAKPGTHPGLLGGKPHWDDLDAECYKFDRNDKGNGDRLRARFGRDLLAMRAVGWVCWTGTHWEVEGGDDGARVRAHRTCGAITREAWHCWARGPQPDEKEPDFIKRLSKIMGFAVQSGNRGRVDGMLTEASPYLAVTVDEMNPDPFKVNLLNGTLDLNAASGAVAPHDRADKITHVLDVNFDADAACPRFMRFLKEVLPDQEVREFLRRWFGYCLSGDVSEQVFVFFHGDGSNGKSALIDAICRILGGYSASLPFSSLLKDDNKRGAEPSPDMARLPGKRLVRASEPEKGARFSEAMIKSMTGGEPMTVRHLNEAFFDFYPEFKLCIQGNHKPQIQGVDHGIWRRLLLVLFEQEFNDDDIDPDLEKDLWAERSGILNWMVDGFYDWREQGLAVPDAVRMATKDYRADSDPLRGFINDCIRDAPGVTVQAREMYLAYTAWCQANAERVWSSTAFGKGLAERGLKKVRSGLVKYSNVELHDVPWTEAGENPPPPRYSGPTMDDIPA